MRDAKIVTKKVGEATVATTEISLFIASFGKVFAQILLTRLQKLAKRFYPE